MIVPRGTIQVCGCPVTAAMCSKVAVIVQDRAVVFGHCCCQQVDDSRGVVVALGGHPDLDISSRHPEILSMFGLPDVLGEE
ncbi:MAG: hypothetical protein ACRDTE_11195 [Pseudonocardiaceae bacterium]